MQQIFVRDGYPVCADAKTLIDDAQRLGLPLFTLALGLLDGLRRAMWVLLFPLAMLVRQSDRRRIALIAGTFVFVSAAVYYAFMAAWLNVFLAVGVVALAVVVNLVELLCTAGLPAIYTAVLAQQPLATAAHLTYLGLYAWAISPTTR